MTWTEFWQWFKNISPELQQKTLKDNDIKEFIGSLIGRYQLEVLEDAPKNVVSMVYSELDDKTKKKLGYKSQVTRIWVV